MCFSDIPFTEMHYLYVPVVPSTGQFHIQTVSKFKNEILASFSVYTIYTWLLYVGSNKLFLEFHFLVMKCYLSK